MKKLLLVMGLLVITFFVIIAKSQESPNMGPINPMPDILYISQFDLTPDNTSASSPNTLLLGTFDFFQKFGNPGSFTTEYSEELESNITHYNYSGMEVWYLENRIQAINISSGNYAFKLTNGTTIKVGDNISNVVNLFPNSWNNVQFVGQVFVSLSDSNGPVDMNLLFEYSAVSGLITSISVQG